MANDNKRQNPQPPQGPHGPRKQGKNGGDDKFEVRRAARTLIFWIMMILIVIAVSTYLSPREEESDTVTYTEYREYLENGRIAEGVVVDREFRGTLKPGAETGEEDQSGRFVTVLPFVNDEMVADWEEKGIKIEFQEEATNWLGMLLTSILPWVILIAIWIFFMRRMSGGASRGIFNFGKSRAKLLTENKPKVTFDDVAGGDEAKEELQEIIQFLKDPKKFQKLGGRIPKGGLLVGPPGTGKTLFARAVAGEAGVPFFSMSGADFVEMFVGVGASRVRDLFEQGKQNAPCIIFIDEIDAVGRQRGAGLGGGHDEREQTLNQLLVEMDGFESNEGVILIAATNRPDVLDPALLRPGRFDRQIVVDRPDVRGREGILKVHTRKIPLAEDVNLKVLAKGTPGLAGADLANLVNEAALIAARRNKDKVDMLDFEEAKDKVMMGTERRSMLISDEEKKLTAYHEAGHVLVAKHTPGSDPVHKVTIIPRGRALGVTHYLPIDEKHSWAKTYIENKMVHLMGGRAAERLVFDDYTNGAASDIKQVTGVARRMVTEWGMSEKIGPLDLANSDSEVFLGRDFQNQKDYSDHTALEIDREVKRLVMQAQNRAVDILSENMEQLHALAQALLEHEILDGEEIDLVIEGKELPPPETKAREREKKKEKEAAAERRRSSRRASRGRMDEGQVETGGKEEEAPGVQGRPGRRSTGRRDPREREQAIPDKPPVAPKPGTPQGGNGGGQEEKGSDEAAEGREARPQRRQAPARSRTGAGGETRSGEEGRRRAAEEERAPKRREEPSRSRPEREEAEEEAGGGPSEPSYSREGITPASEREEKPKPRGEPVGRKARGTRRRDRSRRNPEDRIREAEEALRRLEGGGEEDSREE